MTYANPDALVSTEWLAQHLDDPKVRVLDGTYHLPTAKRDAGAEFAAAHIPSALRFDIDDICDPDDPLPHMLPSTDRFAEKVGALGISSDTRVIAYDVYGMQSAARVWWMFRVFGHDNVAVLSGGQPKWQAGGHPATAAVAKPAPAAFKAHFRPRLVRSRAEMLATIEGAGGEQIVDVRTAGRFHGTEPEPRAGMRSGHMPGALNLPYGKLLAPADKTFLPADGLRAAFAEGGLDLNRPVASSCGSGVTACILALGLHLVGKTDVAVYDGSWSEWGGRADTPIETG